MTPAPELIFTREKKNGPSGLARAFARFYINSRAVALKASAKINTASRTEWPFNQARNRNRGIFLFISFFSFRPPPAPGTARALPQALDFFSTLFRRNASRCAYHGAPDPFHEHAIRRGI